MWGENYFECFLSRNAISQKLNYERSVVLDHDKIIIIMPSLVKFFVSNTTE